ncbi:MAG: hypothetical protein WAT92_12785 [Saprospiraceae bacterium]
MNTDFCEAFLANDKDGIKKSMKPFLDSINVSIPEKDNFESLINWLEQKPCIQQVRLIDRIILTDPPIAQFELLPEDTMVADLLILKITFNVTYKFYDLITNN